MSDTTVFREQWRPSADGLELYNRYYDAAGATAPAVVCLPGLTRNSRDFESLAAHLALSYRVVCPDLRGRGRSARDPKWQNYHPGTYLSDVAALLTQLGLTRVAIIGTSLGGLLAMLLPSVRPGLVAGIVLNDIGPEVDPVGAARIRGYAGRLPAVHTWNEAVAQLRTVFEAAWPDLPDDAWSRLARRSYTEDDSGRPVPDVDPNIGEAFRAAPAAAGDLWPVFAALGNIPILAIRGALSDILSEPTFVRMQRERPDLISLTVANRGHVPLLDEPECMRAIDGFLGGLAW